jgi:multidrug efflux pump subunit AcrB
MKTRQARTSVVVSLLALVGLLSLSSLAVAEEPNIQTFPSIHFSYNLVSGL